jgi:hypothetical protein
MFQCPVEIIQDFKQWENEISFTRVVRAHLLPHYAPAIVVEIGQSSQIQLVLAAKLCFKPP